MQLGVAEHMRFGKIVRLGKKRRLCKKAELSQGFLSGCGSRSLADSLRSCVFLLKCIACDFIKVRYVTFFQDVFYIFIFFEKHVSVV